MPGLLASGAVPAVVAYARVNEDGTSPDMNSGVETSRSSEGIYLIDLPSNLAQPIGRDVVILTIRVDLDVPTIDALSGINYQWNSTTQIEVHTWANSDGIDRNDLPFDFVLLRSTLTPVVDEPA